MVHSSSEVKVSPYQVHRSYYEANMPQSDQRKLLPTVDQLTPSLDLASEITFSECHSQVHNPTLSCAPGMLMLS